MADLAGQASLIHIVERVRRARDLDGVVVATTTNPEDDAIRDCVRTVAAPVYRGSTDDVLGRTLGAAELVEAATIVRVTGDSPLIDPTVVAHTVEEYCRHRPDYASNSLHDPKYPLGMNVEVFSKDLLRLVEAEAQEQRYREHVTPFIRERPERFGLLSVEPPTEYHRPDLRLTLDTPEDYHLISALYDALYQSDPYFGLDAVLDYLKRHPDLADLNRHVSQVKP